MSLGHGKLHVLRNFLISRLKYKGSIAQQDSAGSHITSIKDNASLGESRVSYGVSLAMPSDSIHSGFQRRLLYTIILETKTLASYMLSQWLGKMKSPETLF